MSKYSEYMTYLKVKYFKIGSVQINEISTDGTMGGNSDLCVPTEKAVKTYVANVLSGAAATAFIEDPANAATGDMLYHDGTDWVLLSGAASCGDMAYFDGTDWQIVDASAAASGDILKLSASLVPTWTTP